MDYKAGCTTNTRDDQDIIVEANSPEEAAVIAHNKQGWDSVAVKAAWRAGINAYQIFDADGWLCNSYYVEVA